MEVVHSGSCIGCSNTSTTSGDSSMSFSFGSSASSNEWNSFDFKSMIYELPDATEQMYDNLHEVTTDDTI